MPASVKPIKTAMGSNYTVVSKEDVDEIVRLMHYNEAFLDPNDPKSTSSEYFKEMSYFIDLKGNPN